MLVRYIIIRSLSCRAWRRVSLNRLKLAKPVSGSDVNVISSFSSSYMSVSISTIGISSFASVEAWLIKMRHFFLLVLMAWFVWREGGGVAGD